MLYERSRTTKINNGIRNLFMALDRQGEESLAIPVRFFIAVCFCKARKMENERGKISVRLRRQSYHCERGPDPDRNGHIVAILVKNRSFLKDMTTRSRGLPDDVR